MTFRFRKHKRHDLDYDVKKKTVVPAEVINNCVKYIFVGRMFVDIADTATY
jgi:hypothetical protein